MKSVVKAKNRSVTSWQLVFLMALANGSWMLLAVKLVVEVLH